MKIVHSWKMDHCKICDPIIQVLYNSMFAETQVNTIWAFATTYKAYISFFRHRYKGSAPRKVCIHVLPISILHIEEMPPNILAIN